MHHADAAAPFFVQRDSRHRDFRSELSDDRVGGRMETQSRRYQPQQGRAFIERHRRKISIHRKIALALCLRARNQ